MKPLSLIIAAFAVVLSSCSNQPLGSNKDQAVPKPLQNDEKISDVISIKRMPYGSLVEALYVDAVAKNPDLEKLENELSAFDVTKGDSLRKVEKYKSRSADFYDSGERLSETIADSTLKKKISALIEASEKRYQSKTANLNHVVKRIEQNEVSIKDYHNILKLMVTIPIIEKYQDQELRDVTRTANVIVNASESLKSNAKGLAGKYEKAKK